MKFFMQFLTKHKTAIAASFLGLTTGYWIGTSTDSSFFDEPTELISTYPPDRGPQSFTDIFKALERAKTDIENLSSANRDTLVPMVKSLTEAAYNLKTEEIFPSTEVEKKEFADRRQEWMEMLFASQLKLREKMMQFHAEKPLSDAEVAAFRKGNMYLDYAQDFVIQEWAATQTIESSANLFEGQFPVTLQNKDQSYFKLAAGDVILVRGGSFISSTIARSGDFVTNFSHVAIVVQDPTGKLGVAEALLETGLVMYSVEDYLKLEKLSRAVVMRPKDQAMAKRAALEAYRIMDADLKSKDRVIFDLSMDPDNHDRIYCAEFVKMSYERASNGRLILPEFPMTFNRSIESSAFFAGLGQHLRKGFSPADIYFSPSMDVVMVHRDLSLLKKSWVWDVATSAIFDYTANRFGYKQKFKSVITAYAAYTLKKIGFKMERVPKGVGTNIIQTILEHQALSEDLHKELMTISEKSHRPLAYRDLEKKAFEFLDKNQKKYFVNWTPPAPGSNR